ncbi:TRAP transporter large permease subunit [Ahrensia sp. R2A130]|uniref:TRAP transporter large permease n=1 Tax=Ahrensia sp. R2A130 TaxID=744979 RepID=UPI0001E0BC9B|nr:TRAP transporter large permease subunit [Ahrensia sp. R2A130]EFL88764.1 C4 dicarboxylate transporter permease [Ahrensia sp. R2A130]
MELFFLLLLLIIMATALGSGYPVAFALPGAAIITITLAALAGWAFAGSPDAYFAQGGPGQWLSAGVTNLRGIYWEVERDTLIAIPLFIFMGIMLQRSKIAEDLLMTMAQLFGPVPGGLGISVVFVGALLAATTGIVGATVVAMGLISLPAMLRNNYSPSLATGTIAASGTLGQIIPPSIVLIILADQLAAAVDQAGTTRKALYKASTGELTMPSPFGVTSTSAGEMFLGALIPGLLLVALYMIYILVTALLFPKKAPAVPNETGLDKVFWQRLALVLVPPLALIFLVLGTILAGIATVNQAGAIGAAGALIMSGYRLKEGQKGAYLPAILALVSIAVIAVVVSNFNTNIKAISTANDQIGIIIALIASAGLIGALVWSAVRAYRTDNTLSDVMIETAKATSLVFIILLGAAMLTAAFRAFGGEELVQHFLEGVPGGFWAKFIVVMAIMFVLGFFLDFIEIAVVVVPIMAPILLADPSANVTAVWLGVMIGLNIQTSFLTPPFGFALFYLRGVAPAVVKTLDMYKGVIGFICLQLSALFIVAQFPQLVNYLPNRVSLLGETAPPPRNPRLQYCVENYIHGRFQEPTGRIVSAQDNLKALDVSYLPANLQKALEESYAATGEARDKLIAAKAVEAREGVAADAFRPLHVLVRGYERDARALDADIERLRVRASRMRSEDQAEARAQLEQRIADEEAERDALLAQIPEDWVPRRDAFKEIVKEQAQLRNEFRRSSSTAYTSVKNLQGVLAGNEDFNAFVPILDGLMASLQGVDSKEGQALIKAAEDAVSRVDGTSKVKSALSKARRGMRRNPPRMDDVETNVAEARRLLAVQGEWRAQVTPEFVAALDEYELAMRDTVGLTQQRRLSREQALFVASCQSGHRDISLNF